MEDIAIRRILLVSYACYLDDFAPASIARRRLLEALARRHFAVEALCGPALGLGAEVDLPTWLLERGWEFHHESMRAADGRTPGENRTILPAHLALAVGPVPITLLSGGRTTSREATDRDRSDFVTLFRATAERFAPDVVAVAADDRLAREILAEARSRGAATVLFHDFRQRDAALFTNVDSVIAPTRFAADFHRRVFGLTCKVLPPLAGPTHPPESHDPAYVSLIDPTPARGGLMFARIADELGKQRPDIPLLVIERSADSAVLTDCGVDLQAHGNVGVLPYPTDPDVSWGLTRICLFPWLSWEEFPGDVVEALHRQVPIVASDRGALPELLGGSSPTFAIPDRLTPVTRSLPTADEVRPWVDAIIRLWDDRAPAEPPAHALRFATEPVEDEYAAFFSAIRAGSNAPAVDRPAPAKNVVLVPHLNGIEPECEVGLRSLEAAGVTVTRHAGCSAIDLARNALASDAVRGGFESILFIDADIGFEPVDAMRLFARPEPVVAGVYAMKGRQSLAGHFTEDSTNLLFGPDVAGPYPIKYAAAGFLRIKTWVLERMIEELKLPHCNTRWGTGFWPFFLPLIIPEPDGRSHYLSEDFAFSHRLSQIGVTPLCDTSFRLWHWGRYGYSWEEAARPSVRHRSFLLMDDRR